MENHRINQGTDSYPDISEVVLVEGDEKDRNKWMIAKVIKHIRGRDGVVRGVSLLHKGHVIERPLTLVSPLKIKAATPVPPVTAVNQQQKPSVLRPRRTAAETARTRYRVAAEKEVC